MNENQWKSDYVFDKISNIILSLLINYATKTVKHTKLKKKCITFRFAVIVESVRLMNHVGLNAFLEITPAKIVQRIDDANAMVDCVGHWVLAFQVYPSGKLHQLIGQLLHVKVVQCCRANDHLETASIRINLFFFTNKWKYWCRSFHLL